MLGSGVVARGRLKGVVGGCVLRERGRERERLGAGQRCLCQGGKLRISEGCVVGAGGRMGMV